MDDHSLCFKNNRDKTENVFRKGSSYVVFENLSFGSDEATFLIVPCVEVEHNIKE